MNGWAIFRSSLYQRRTATLWFSLSVAAYSVLIAWYYPMIEKVDYEKLLESFPPEMIELFAGDAADLSTFGGFLATEYLGLIWVAIIAGLAISLATKALSGEVAQGTMELILTQPVDRMVLVVARWAAMAVNLAVVCLATTLPLWAAAKWQDISVDVGHLMALTGVGLLLGLAIGGIAYALAAFSNDSGKPAGLVAGLLVAMWLIAFMAGQAEWAEALNPVNLLHYWNPARLVEKGTVETGALIAYSVTALAGFAIALVGFTRRDVS